MVSSLAARPSAGGSIQYPQDKSPDNILHSTEETNDAVGTWQPGSPKLVLGLVELG